MTSKRSHQGRKWIRDEKRLAIYLRDGLACCYCGQGVEHGVILTLDHIKPKSKGGSNEAGNLITVCHSCNTYRGVKSWTAFAAQWEAVRNLPAGHIVSLVGKLRRRAIDVGAAKELIAARGGMTSALKKGE